MPFDDVRVRWELTHAKKAGALREGEIVCDGDECWFDDQDGALVVTDQRVLFLRTTAIRKRTSVTEIPLMRIEKVEVGKNSSPGRIGGSGVALTLTTTAGDGQGTRYEFRDLEPEARAQELAGTIVQQRGFLRGPGPSSSPEG